MSNEPLFNLLLISVRLGTLSKSLFIVFFTFITNSHLMHSSLFSGVLSHLYISSKNEVNCVIKDINVMLLDGQVLIQRLKNMYLLLKVWNLTNVIVTI
jgi:hypothetical protein